MPWFGWAKPGKTTSNRLFGLVGLSLGLAGLFSFGQTIFFAAGQHGWLPVEAVVVRSQTTESSKGSGFRTYRNHHFTYRYQVDGVSYSGGRYSYWSISGEPATGVANYRPGDELVVYHHPRWPRHAVVERLSPSVFSWLFAALSLFIAVPAGRLLVTGRARG